MEIEDGAYIKILNFSLRKDFLVFACYFVFLIIIWNIILTFSLGEDSLAMLLVYGFFVSMGPLTLIFIIALITKQYLNSFKFFVSRRFITLFTSVFSTVILLLLIIYFIFKPSISYETLIFNFIAIPFLGVIFASALLLEILLKLFKADSSKNLKDFLAVFIVASIGVSLMPFLVVAFDFGFRKIQYCAHILIDEARINCENEKLFSRTTISGNNDLEKFIKGEY